MNNFAKVHLCPVCESALGKRKLEDDSYFWYCPVCRDYKGQDTAIDCKISLEKFTRELMDILNWCRFYHDERATFAITELLNIAPAATTITVTYKEHPDETGKSQYSVLVMEKLDHNAWPYYPAGEQDQSDELAWRIHSYVRYANDVAWELRRTCEFYTTLVSLAVEFQGSKGEIDRCTLPWAKLMEATDIEWDADPEADEEPVTLPKNVLLPPGMTDTDQISEYLSDTTGYCPKSFCLEVGDLTIRLNA